MGRLIDSSVFITLERRGLSLAALPISGSETVALASVTASELLVGVHRAGDASRRARRESFVESVLAAVPVAPFDLLVARTHARLSAELAAAGNRIGEHDAMIAATALTHGFSVLTENRRDFDRVAGLVVETPAW